jgi:hypothetical protein
LGAGKRPLAIDHPALARGLAHQPLKVPLLAQGLQRAVELEVALGVEALQALAKLGPEDGAQGADMEEVVRSCKCQSSLFTQGRLNARLARHGDSLSARSGSVNSED